MEDCHTVSISHAPGNYHQHHYWVVGRLALRSETRLVALQSVRPHSKPSMSLLGDPKNLQFVLCWREHICRHEALHMGVCVWIASKICLDTHSQLSAKFIVPTLPRAMGCKRISLGEAVYGQRF